jgi:hypothetical protein
LIKPLGIQMLPRLVDQIEQDLALPRETHPLRRALPRGTGSRRGTGGWAR